MVTFYEEDESLSLFFCFIHTNTRIKFHVLYRYCIVCRARSLVLHVGSWQLPAASCQLSTARWPLVPIRLPAYLLPAHSSPPAHTIPHISSPHFYTQQLPLRLHITASALLCTHNSFPHLYTHRHPTPLRSTALLPLKHNSSPHFY
jgi:hypothetical protein